MIRIEIFKDHGEYKGFKVSGHSGYADEGSDIVCASVSALVINTVNSLEKFTEDEFESNIDENGALIEIGFKDPLSSGAKLLMDSLTLGLESVREGSKEYMTITCKEV